jgi:ubiquinone/menaquinone biosynthesis C-methylase UbiE
VKDETFIHEYWESQAKKYGGTHCASWGDTRVIELEIQTIGGYIREGYEVLDVGCANGYSTLHHCERNPQRIVGIDYSASMINEAEKNKKKVNPHCDVAFMVGDARNIPLAKESFDIVYTTRTLINLPSWEDQKQAILECIRVCRKGGTIVFSEAFWEPMALLNALRALVLLPSLAEHDCNRFLMKRDVTDFIASLGLKHEVVDFCSLYYLGTRFLKELIKSSQEHFAPSQTFEDVFSDLQQQYTGESFGIQLAFVVRH